MTALNITRAYKESVLNGLPTPTGKLYQNALTMCERLRGENLQKVGHSYAFKFEQDGVWYLYYITSTREAVIDYEATTPCFL